MGKAGRWIRSLLGGKKEEKYKKKYGSFSGENVEISTAIVPVTPKEKRRWSFGHKSSRALGSIVFPPLVNEGSPKQKNEQSFGMAVAVAATATAQTTMAETNGAGKHSEVEHAAATKIQAIFRSYLARKALCALRGLVKLQALVRGHQVRKQANTTLRRMHALMAIQVRARVQRIQVAEEAQIVVNRQSSVHRNFHQDNWLRIGLGEKMEVNQDGTQGDSNNRHGFLNYSQIQRIEQGIIKYYSGELTPHHYSPMYRSNSTRKSFCFPQADCHADSSPHYPFLPNYMANTECSKAKARSQSEPKQRPKWGNKQKSRQTTLVGEASGSQHVQRQHPTSHAGSISIENPEPWLIKLYQSTMALKDSECDSNSTVTSTSNYCTPAVAYEPHVTMF
ncbi:hypothetical protein AAG906_026638 [Vitis piasezkii]